jgi:ABC-type multidrug transport system fused ATPase/permease subunit
MTSIQPVVPVAKSGKPFSGPATTDRSPAEDASGLPTVRGLFGAHWGRILFTYSLYNLENLLRLGQPFFLGWAITDLLQSSAGGLALFLGQHLVFLLIGAARRMYDTRAFTRIYTDLATRLVLVHRRHEVPISRIAARSALSREIVDFFERDVPFVVQTAYSVVGALIMLACCDWVLFPLCLALLLPVYVLSRVYGRQTFGLNRRLHDELEQEVDVIATGKPRAVRSHYERVARWRVRLSDAEAAGVAVVEVLILGLTAVVLWRCCTTAGADAGYISTVLGYILMFVSALTNLPLLVEQLARLRDIARRVQPASSDSKSNCPEHA